MKKIVGHNADVVNVILQNADGALNEAYEILKRMTELKSEASDELKTNVDKILEMQSDIGTALNYMVKQAC